MAVTETERRRRFPSPFEVPTPPGAEGWERMFPYYLLFSKENQEYEDSVFWFQDAMHHGEVQFPFDTICHEAWGPSLGGYNSRVFAVPPAYGIGQRILNGYTYVTTVPVSSERWMAERGPIFMKRAGYYYQNWDRLFAAWKVKMQGVIDALKAISVPRLPRLEEETVVFDGVGINRGHRLLTAYNAVIDNIFLAYQYHFEMLNLGYAAYLNLFMFCRQAFPGIKDETVAQMAAGADILFFRPDDELKKLARLALELGVAERVRGPGRPPEIVAELARTAAGKRWLDALEAVKDPWFHFSTGAGMYHHEPTWLDDLTVPWAALTGYIGRLEQGENLDRPKGEVLGRRERLTAEYRELLPSDQDRETFDQNVGLARTVAPYIEDHQVYVEHWHHTVWWSKIRDFGDRLAEAGFLEEREDVFFLNRWEIGQALYDMVMAWASGATPRGPRHWPAEVRARKRMREALQAAPPPPALGPVPAEISEPFTVMLWGITTERVQEWLGGGEGTARELKGVAGAPGVAEGKARVILSATRLDEVEQGEILVCPITAPSWGAVFGKIKATVSDIGGVMSHAAIVSREYGKPAVVGTGHGTKTLKTGQTIRVDGDTGLVTILP